MPGATQVVKYSLREVKLPRAAWVSLGPNPFFLMAQESASHADSEVTWDIGMVAHAAAIGPYTFTNKLGEPFVHVS
jgi:hypothetical protein